MNMPKFGSLESAKALAASDGYTIVYDNHYKRISPPNLTGAVALKDWPGLTGKDGGEYEYAYDGAKILAQPELPQNHGLNLTPNTREVLEVLRKAMKMREAIGPNMEFLLGGDKSSNLCPSPISTDSA